MTWVRLDEEFARHPKVLAAGPLGMAMQVAALCYCNEYLTDGFVPRAAVAGLLDFTGLAMRMWSGELVGGGEDAEWSLVVEDLLGAGLWAEEKGGYRIHDYHDYQPSKQDVIELREKRAEAGRKGGKAARAKQVLEPVLDKGSSKSPSKTEAKMKPGSGSVSVKDKPLAPTRRRDEIWDAMVEICGSPPTTKSGRGAWNAAVKEIREAGDATPSEVERRAAEYRRRFPGIVLTPTALAKWWGQVSIRANGAGTPNRPPMVSELIEQGLL